MDWQHNATRLWGDDWIAPMSDVLGINRRTIERWNAGDGAPNQGIQTEMRRLAFKQNSRELGTVLRRIAKGETLEDIRRDYREHTVAAHRIAAEIQKGNLIAILATRGVYGET